jgi:hypothetical protein
MSAVNAPRLKPGKLTPFSTLLRLVTIHHAPARQSARSVAGLSRFQGSEGIAGRHGLRPQRGSGN